MYSLPPSSTTHNSLLTWTRDQGGERDEIALDAVPWIQGSDVQVLPQDGTPHSLTA